MDFINNSKQKILDCLKGKNIAVLYGGMSEEREVSLRSGKNIYNALCSFDEIKENVFLTDVKNGRSLSDELFKNKIDVCYNILHGTYGEDGKIQGMLDMLGIKYTGENVVVSSLCMDKIKTKLVWNAFGIKNPEFAFVSDYVSHDSSSVFFGNKKIYYPFIAKPIENGSSVSVHLVKDSVYFEKILHEIKNKDYFIEEYIKGKECTVGVLPAPSGEKYIFPILGIFPKKELYDYEAKYTKGMTDFEIPFKVEKSIEKKIKNTARDAYNALGARGLCRIDAIVKDNGEVYLLECNTQPGMTETSDVPEMVKASSVNFGNLVLYILGLAIYY